MATQNKIDDYSEGESPSTRPTNAELMNRIQVIVQFRIQGARANQIWRYVSEQTTWGVSRRTVERYMNSADKEIRRMKERDMDIEWSKAMLRLEELYYKCNSIQDYKNCLQVQKEINELLGFKTLDIRTTDTNKADLSKYGFKQLFFLKHGRQPTEDEMQEFDDEQEDPGINE